jgi:N,N'-diacetyllegionaminate synthase
MIDSAVAVLFLVPARGGSKGFPGKNLARLAGIPLVGRAARVARRVALLLGPGCRVVCSTDDPEIARAARAWGAETPFLRPADLATDEARTMDVVFHTLDTLGVEFDVLTLLQPTSPLADMEDVLGAIHLHLETGSPVVSVCAAEHPVEWFCGMADDGRLSSMLPEKHVHRRQAAGVIYRPNGAVYVAAPETLRKAGSFMTEATRGFLMPAERSIDIDAPLDITLSGAILEARKVSCIEISGRKIGSGWPCFVIAEAGVNHNGSLDLALKLVDAAAAAGADAVKFQTFRADRLVTTDAPKAEYQARATGGTGPQYEMLKRLELDEAAHRALVARCESRGVLFLSTPFDEESSDFLESLGLPAFKLPSGELTNLPFLAHVAGKGKPVILSTGMATLQEVDAAVATIARSGNNQLVLLQCVSEYPADPMEANLRAMASMRASFGCPVGFSDHTLGIAVPIAAAALGASVVEKHFTLDHHLPGADHRASLEPHELAEMVRGIRVAESALGNGDKRPGAGEAAIARAVRKSLVAACNIFPGTVLGPEHIAAKRPGTGIPPDMRSRLLGRRIRVAVPPGTLFEWEMLE